MVIAAVVAVAGLWYSSDQARDDRALAKEGQITDRYTAAVGNLGSDKTDVPLGGIYALQRIMQDSRRDHPTIANVLATYIRTHAAKPAPRSQDVTADIQAALTVLATRDPAHDGAFRPDLRDAKLDSVELGSESLVSPAALGGADLTGADLGSAFLSGANLRDANLSLAQMTYADLRRADLRDADLSSTFLDGADLPGANLSGADMTSTKLGEADLRGANLRGANLRGADLDDADLRGADLRGANLRFTSLRGTDLRGAKNVTTADSTYVNSGTRLP
ncbi:pentapeptide repeat-containing protein [Streptomyces sp. SID3212]|uniref:pentapeptide repeat-containing protein n=1 Tax=Streptomyces sp. SID3212 TaxID=2690259 RepID=UPI00137101DC|nr:pentapeptide repeat-containing protein [Streptomyces sp. SID3212]